MEEKNVILVMPVNFIQIKPITILLNKKCLNIYLIVMKTYRKRRCKKDEEKVKKKMKL